MVEEHDASGLSVRAFCERESVAEASFYGWRKEIRRRDHVPGSVDPALIPVKVVDPDSAISPPNRVDAQLELLTSSGYTLRFAQDIDLSRLGLLLTVIANGVQGATSC